MAQAVLGAALHPADLQEHLGPGAAGDLLELAPPGGVSADIDERPPPPVLGVLEDRPLPCPASCRGAPPVSHVPSPDGLRPVFLQVASLENLSWLRQRH